MTNTSLVQWTLTVKLRSPFIIPGASVNATAVDTLPAVNGEGTPIIPSSLIRGLFRDAVATAQYQDVLALFGSKSGDTSSAADWRESNEPNRRCLNFTDLVSVDRRKSATLTRVSIDNDRTKAGKEGHLQFIELIAPLGEIVTFKGTITCQSAKCDDVRAQLLSASRLIRAIGSNKSSGFGEIAEPIELMPIPNQTTIALPTAPVIRGHIEIAFAFDRPFLVDAERTAANQFKGRETVPGAVLKGALAPFLKAAGATDQTIASLHIGHAFPAVSGGDPAPIMPLSLALCKTGKGMKLYDLLHIDDVTKIMSDDDCGPPVLAIDWKDADRRNVLEKCGSTVPALSRDIRTRTAIDGHSGTAAYDDDTESGQIFSYSAVCPDKHVWVSRFYIPDEIDDHTLMNLTRILWQGIPNIGKTRATATAQTQRMINPQTVSAGTRLWALTLQTDAALGNGSKADYAAYWQAQGFQLIRHFAQQRLVGGYQALRYPANDDGYQPYVLTCAGSVFLVKGAGEMLEPLLHKGLPPTEPYRHRNWQKFPFGRENGFGAVRLDVVDHARLAGGEDA